ncbi:hypothetical protein [Cupriavidus sp. DL-D2]|uniref:hypothetical protein n=1 Tax=Cupriavidus sp. DL-D2 TaxID=3144974 RepID=UPI00321428C7
MAADRHLLTIPWASGCNLFNSGQLRLDYGGADFEHLLMCILIDDTASVASPARGTCRLVEAGATTTGAAL